MQRDPETSTSEEAKRGFGDSGDEDEEANKTLQSYFPVYIWPWQSCSSSEQAVTLLVGTREGGLALRHSPFFRIPQNTEVRCSGLDWGYTVRCVRQLGCNPMIPAPRG
jgi:hypothetical protein